MTAWMGFALLAAAVGGAPPVLLSGWRGVLAGSALPTVLLAALWAPHLNSSLLLTPSILLSIALAAAGGGLGALAINWLGRQLEVDKISPRHKRVVLVRFAGGLPIQFLVMGVYLQLTWRTVDWSVRTPWDYGAFVLSVCAGAALLLGLPLPPRRRRFIAATYTILLCLAQTAFMTWAGGILDRPSLR